MKTKAFITFLGCLWSTTGVAQTHADGHEVGNGGGAWVCSTSQSTINWIQTVDLFEAENEFDLILETYTDPLQQIVDRVMQRIQAVDPQLYRTLAPRVSSLELLSHSPPAIVRRNDPLAVVDDAAYRLVPSTARCPGGEIHYEQVVNFTHQGRILVQSQLFEALSPRDQAALVVHEALYHYRRERFRDSHSAATRRIIGLLFSTLPEAQLAGALRSPELDSHGVHQESGLVRIRTQGVISSQEMDPRLPTIELSPSGPRSHPCAHGRGSGCVPVTWSETMTNFLVVRFREIGRLIALDPQTGTAIGTGPMQRITDYQRLRVWCMSDPAVYHQSFVHTPHIQIGVGQVAVINNSVQLHCVAPR